MAMAPEMAPVPEIESLLDDGRDLSRPWRVQAARPVTFIVLACAAVAYAMGRRSMYRASGDYVELDVSLNFDCKHRHLCKLGPDDKSTTAYGTARITDLGHDACKEACVADPGCTATEWRESEERCELHTKNVQQLTVSEAYFFHHTDPISPDEFTCCLKKICTCTHGVAVSNANCPAKGHEKCSSCNDGYYLDGDICKECSPDVASCPKGELFICGDNGWGQQGLGHTCEESSCRDATNSPKKMTTAGFVDKISSGDDSTFFRIGGTWYCVGENNEGECGVNIEGVSDILTAKEVRVPGSAEIFGGGDQSAAVLTDGTVKAWGDGGDCAVLPNNEDDVYNPTDVGIQVTSAAIGDSHALFLAQDGKVFALGDSYVGQTGLGAEHNDSNACSLTEEVKVPAGHKVVSMAAGDSHSLLVLSSGQVMAMGRNYDYTPLCVGPGQELKVYEPTLIPGLSNVKAAYAGNGFSYFLLENGDVLSCGRNDNGQLCTGDTDTRDVPTPVTLAKKATKISAGSSHVMILLEDGTVMGCGGNGYGQLGVGDLSHRSSPTKALITDVRDISAHLADMTVFLK